MGMNQNHNYFLSDRQKLYVLACHKILVMSLCVPYMKKVKIAVLMWFRGGPEICVVWVVSVTLQCTV